MDFYSVLSSYYDELFPLSRGCRSFVRGKLEPGQSLLDAGCGTGELVIAQKKEGIDARGFDLDEGMILSAASEASRAGLSGDDLFNIAELGDIRDHYEARSLDVLSCLGNTLVHIPFNRQFQFLQDGRELLKPGGLLILQILNYSNILHGGMPFPLIETEHCIFRRSYAQRDLEGELDFMTELEIRENGTIYSNSIIHYPLMPETLMAALSMAGYSEWETYGSYAGDAAGEGTLPLIVTARIPS